MSNTFETDVKPVLNMFADLSYNKQKKAYKNALRKACNIVAKETRKQLKNEIGKAATHKGKYGKSLTQGIKVKVLKDGLAAKIHIMGDYRLKWFEMGTKVRHLKKNGANRGQMQAVYFFKKARLSKEKEAANSLEKNLEAAIIKINNKHK